MIDTTEDGFLGGRLTIRQPARGYRAGVDAVLLAAAIPAAPGDTVLELGLGVGVASLCLGRRIADLDLAGVEVQADYAELARLNAATNGIALDVVDGDLRALPPELKTRHFDHVIANPPYYLRDRGSRAAEAGREVALAESVPLAEWTDAATRRLKPGGMLSFILKAERLADAITAIDRRLGSIAVKPIAPRRGRAAELVILQARKGGRGAFRLLSPLIMHEGDRHEHDGESYRPDVRAILRDGSALTLA